MSISAAMLGAIYSRFLSEANWIRLAFQNCQSMHASPPQQSTRIPVLSAEMVIVRLHDLWARFCRELIVLSATGQATTIQGLAIPPVAGVIHRSDVIPLLLSKYKKRKYEPYWAHANEAIDAAQRLGLSNLSTIATSLGSVTSPEKEVRAIRNFFAHRSKDTALYVRAQSWCPLSAKLDPFVLAGQPVSGGATLLELWINRFEAVAYSAIQ